MKTFYVDASCVARHVASLFRIVSRFEAEAVTTEPKTTQLNQNLSQLNPDELQSHQGMFDFDGGGVGLASTEKKDW